MNINGSYITCRKATGFQLWTLDTVVLRADPLRSTLAWLQNEQYYPSQNGNQYSDSGFLLNHQSHPLTDFQQILPQAWENKQAFLSIVSCSSCLGPGAALAEQSVANEWANPQLPQASSLITPIQQNGPCNCPDQYYLFCVQKRTILPHCFLGNWKFLWPIKSCFSCNWSEARRLFVSMAGCWAIYRSI